MIHKIKTLIQIEIKQAFIENILVGAINFIILVKKNYLGSSFRTNLKKNRLK